MQARRTLISVAVLVGITRMASASDYTCTANGYWNDGRTWNNQNDINDPVPAAADFASIPACRTVIVAADQTEGVGILNVAGTLVFSTNAILVVDGLPAPGDTGYGSPGFHSITGQINLSGDSCALQFADRDQILDDGDTGSGRIAMWDPNAAVQIQSTRKLTCRIIIEGEGYIQALSGTATLELEQRTSTVGGVVRAYNVPCGGGQLDLASNLRLHTTPFASGLNNYMPRFVADGEGATLRFMREADGSPDPVLDADFYIQGCAVMRFDQSVVTSGSFCWEGTISLATTKCFSWAGSVCENPANSPICTSGTQGCP